MLVLSRKPGERIICGDVIITLVQTNTGRARIGIEAPDHVNIVREELTLEPEQPEGKKHG